MGRIGQFCKAILACITPKDRDFLHTHLSAAEQHAFFSMGLPEQRHALDVAYTAQRLAAKYPAVDSNLLINAALLHDIGKRKGEITIPDKVATVLGYSLVPRMAARLARQGRENWFARRRHAFFLYMHHAELGAEFARQVGAPAVVCEWIKKHHQPPQADDVIELALLRIADDQN